MRSCFVVVLGLLVSCAPREPMLMQPLPPGYEYPWRAVSEARVRVGTSVAVARAAVVVHEALGMAARPPSGQPTAGSVAQPASAGRGLVDLNHATPAELDSLPRVGPAMVERIIAARPFESVRGLGRVRGVGDATFAQLEPLVCVDCAAPDAVDGVRDGSGEAGRAPGPGAVR